MRESDLVVRSYGRCLAQNDLLFDRFYDKFLKSSPVIAKMFEKTDMKRQKYLLRAGINYAIMFSSDSVGVAAETVLKGIRNSHSKSSLNISPDLYPLWTNNLLTAIEETDPKFNSEVRLAWIKVLDITVKFITSGYEVQVTS